MDKLTRIELTDFLVKQDMDNIIQMNNPKNFGILEMIRENDFQAYNKLNEIEVRQAYILRKYFSLYKPRITKERVMKNKNDLLEIADSHKQISKILYDVAYGRDTVKEALKRVSPYNKADVETSLEIAGYLKGI